MNKYIYKLLLSFILMNQIGLEGQIIIPPKIEFAGLKENWSYISKDTNFVKSPLDKWSTPYWGHFPIDVYNDQDNIIILESCQAQSPYGLIDGSLVHSLKSNSGEMNWIFHNNSYIGLKNREDYFNTKIFRKNNTSIEIIGYKSIDTIDKTKPAFGFYCNPVLKEIDFKTGMLLAEKEGQYKGNKIHNAVGLAGTFLSRNSSNEFIHHGFYPDVDSLDNYRVKYNVYKLLENMEIDSNIIFSYKYQYSSPNETNIFYTDILDQLSKDTLVLLFTIWDGDDLENSPLESKLVWLNIKNIDDIHVVKELEITEDFYKPQDGKFEPIIQTIDNNIFIHQLMIPLNPTVDTKWLTWLLWLDADGNQIAKVPYIYNKEEQYGFIRVIGLKNGHLYVAVSKHSASEMGMDIIKISRGSSVAIKVGSISTNITSQFEIGNFNTVKMMPNNNLLIGIGMDYIYSSEIKTQIQYYYSFKLEEVGISTPIKETTSTINSLKIFPIPSSSFLQIETLRTYDEIIIYGMNGSTIVKKTNENILDLSNLEAGEYFLDLISNGLSIGKQKFIKL